MKVGQKLKETWEQITGISQEAASQAKATLSTKALPPGTLSTKALPPAMVKNPPANAGDTGSSPGLGRSHMPQSN